MGTLGLGILDTIVLSDDLMEGRLETRVVNVCADEGDAKGRGVEVVEERDLADS